MAQAVQIGYDPCWFGVARRLRILLVSPIPGLLGVKPGNAIRRLL
jgi:hypothetical protein